MNIRILSHREALPEVISHSKKYNVIFITNPGDPFYRPEMHDLIIHAQKALVCQFHDVEFDREKDNAPYWGYIGPTKKDIETIIEFAKNKDDLIVSCHAGVSRSSASAFVIVCSQENPKEALKILDKRRHDPNNLIIKHGSEILGKPEMIDIIQQFKFDMMKEIYG
jgi:predicted protein tyrosine phosphatase